MLSMIVALTENNVIGKDNQMPWYLPTDLRWFKKNTLGKTIVMGRLTYESIGRPLPQRRNIVMSRSQQHLSGCECLTDMASVLQLAEKEELMVIGGGHIYAQFFPYCQRLYLTRIHTVIEGDTFFLALDPDQWRQSYREDVPEGEGQMYDLSFEVLERVTGGC